MAMTTFEVGNTATDRASSARSARRCAAAQLLAAHPEWSDRRIADASGISPKTVAQLRAELPSPVAAAGHDVRVGRDGRVRPVDPGARRALVEAALEAQPDASLRAIARNVGVSPETVRSVRAGRTDPPRHIAAPMPLPLPVRGWSPLPVQRWEPDAALLSREDSAAAASFFERTDVCDADVDRHAYAIPVSRVYEMADEARRRAAVWLQLAQHIEAQAGRSVG